MATLILTYLTFLVWGYRFNATDSVPMSSNIILQAVTLLLVMGISLLMGLLLNPHPKACRIITVSALFITLLFMGAMCFSYVSQTLHLPASDANSCFAIALQFKESDFRAVVPEGSYLSLWPFQTGFIFTLEKIMRVFNETSPLFFQKLNCIYILMILASGYGMVCTLSKRIEGRLLYLGLMATYWPLFFRSTEVYGNVPALAWMMCSCFTFLLYYKAKTRWQQILAVIGFVGFSVLAALYKSNSLIYVIAFVLIVCVQQLRKKDLRFLIVVVLTAILASQITTITQKYYEHYAENTCGEGVPAIAYLAMGLQYTNEEAIPGGWNGFHSSTYMELGYDYDKTVERSKQSIRESLDGFAQNPGFAVHFFHNKALKQWANQTQGMLWDVNGYYDTARDKDAFWVTFLEYGKHRNLLSFMDVHQSLLYGILLAGCGKLLIGRWKKREIDIPLLLPFVTFIGGFLFSLIWEGQTTAVMSYPLLLLPVALGYLFKDKE